MGSNPYAICHSWLEHQRENLLEASFPKKAVGGYCIFIPHYFDGSRQFCDELFQFNGYHACWREQVVLLLLSGKRQVR